MKKLSSILGCVLLGAFLVIGIAQAQTPQVQLTWVDNANNEDGTVVERNLNSSVFQVIISLSGGSVVAYTDSTVAVPTVIGAPDNVYCYRVAAFNAAGNSAYSNTSCKTFVAPKLQVPTGPSGLKTASATTSSITLGWNDNANNETSQEILITQSAPSVITWTVPVYANAVTQRVTNLRRNTQYRAKIRSVGDAGVSRYSNEVIAKTNQ